MSGKLAVLFFLFLPWFVVPEDAVYEYNAGNFRHQIKSMDGNFVMFYAPWCSHCTEFHPIWAELAELVNTHDSMFAIAQVDCTLHAALCQENQVTGYPTLLFFHRNSYFPVEYKGTRDLPALTLFLSEVFTVQTQKEQSKKKSESSVVEIYSGMAYFDDHNIERYISKGQHFIMFYTPWCRMSQKFAPVWSELGKYYSTNKYIRIGKVNCMDSEVTCDNFDVKYFPYLVWITDGRITGTAHPDYLENLKTYVNRMLLAENHDPEKFMKRKKDYPVARISEETFETFMEKDLVFINYFAPWCAHCKQLNPVWVKLGERFMNKSRVLIADVDCAQSKSLCQAEKVSGLPTLILYKKKQIVNVDHGAKPLESLISLVNEHLKPAVKPAETKVTDEEKKATKDEL